MLKVNSNKTILNLLTEDCRLWDCHCCERDKNYACTITVLVVSRLILHYVDQFLIMVNTYREPEETYYDWKIITFIFVINFNFQERLDDFHHNKFHYLRKKQQPLWRTRSGTGELNHNPGNTKKCWNMLCFNQTSWFDQVRQN